MSYMYVLQNLTSIYVFNADNRDDNHVKDIYSGTTDTTDSNFCMNDICWGISPDPEENDLMAVVNNAYDKF